MEYTYMETLSYIASLMAAFFGVCAPYWKKIKIVLCCNFLTNVLTGISYLLVGGYSGAAIAFIGGGQLFVNHIFTQKKGRVPKYIVVMHIAAFVVADILMFKSWYDILMLIASALFVLSIIQTDTGKYRIMYFFNNMLLIIYDFLAKAYGNLTMHSILFSATLIAILIRDLKKKTETKEQKE